MKYNKIVKLLYSRDNEILDKLSNNPAQEEKYDLIIKRGALFTIWIDVLTQEIIELKDSKHEKEA